MMSAYVNSFSQTNKFGISINSLTTMVREELLGEAELKIY